VPSALARQAPGAGSVLVLAATALALMPVALAFAALGRRFDEDGGPVVFARAAFGETTSFLVGWVTFLSGLASTAAVTTGLAGSLTPLLGLPGHTAERVLGAGLATALALVVAAGVSLSARVWTTLTVLKLLPLLALVVAFALRFGDAPGALVFPEQAEWRGAALTTMFSLQGFEIVPVVAGQARSAAHHVPMATLGALAFAGLLYVALQSACVLALPALADSAMPLADAAGFYAGPGLARAVAFGTTLSALGICFGMLVTTPRYLSALAAGGRLGFGFERLSDRGVPRNALLLTWAAVTLLILWGSRGELFVLSSVAVLMQYLVTAAALHRLAQRRERGLGRRHALLAWPAAAVGLAIASAATPRELLVAGTAAALGLLLRRLSRRAAASS
jgi:amino acid transporter